MARAIAARPAPEQRSRLMLIAALIFAAIAAVLVFVALQNRSDGGESTSSGAAATVDVVVAARDIGANTTLTADMLALQPVPADGALTGAFAAVEALVGVPTRFPIQAGEQVTGLKIGLGTVTDEDDISLVLAPGMRAVGVNVSEVTGVGGLLLPGNYVDVIAVFPSAPAGADGDVLENVKSVTLLQNIEVLAVAQEAQQPVPVASDGAEAPGSHGQRPDDAERQPDATSATLAVSPQDAQLLALVQETGGVIWLSLRPAGDQETPSPGESNLRPFFAPAAPEPGF